MRPRSSSHVGALRERVANEQVGRIPVEAIPTMFLLRPCVLSLLVVTGGLLGGGRTESEPGVVVPSSEPPAERSSGTSTYSRTIMPEDQDVEWRPSVLSAYGAPASLFALASSSSL